MTRCHKKIVCSLWVSPTPNLTAFRNASGLVIFFGSKLEVNDPIKRKCADEARSTLLGAGRVCPIPVGALRWASCVRDFSGLGSCSPAIKIIAGEQALF